MVSVEPYIDVTVLTDAAIRYLATGVKFLLAFFIGYLLGTIVSSILRKVLLLDEFQKTLVKYGAMTTKLWAAITNFVSQYVKWLVTVYVISKVFMQIMDLSDFMIRILWFLVFGIIGLILGGILFKIVKEALEHMGLEAELKKHRVHGALGGITVSTALAGIVKWYVVLLFVQEGIARMGLMVLSNFMEGLMNYIPGAIMGILILVVSLLIANFAGQRIKLRDVGFSEVLALGAETVIVYFGVVLALPKFQIDPSILQQTFLILALGASIGMAIALGLGLKDSIGKIGKKK